MARFDERGRPFIQRSPYHTALGCGFSEIDFLLDTGADVTCIHPGDLRPLGIETRFVPAGSAIEASGIGGGGRYFEEIAVLQFEDETETRYYAINLYIAEPNQEMEGLPSVLGRDVVNRWRMIYDPEIGQSGVRGSFRGRDLLGTYTIPAFLSFGDFLERTYARAVKSSTSSECSPSRGGGVTGTSLPSTLMGQPITW